METVLYIECTVRCNRKNIYWLKCGYCAAWSCTYNCRISFAWAVITLSTQIEQCSSAIINSPARYVSHYQLHNTEGLLVLGLICWLATNINSICLYLNHFLHSLLCALLVLHSPPIMQSQFLGDCTILSSRRLGPGCETSALTWHLAHKRLGYSTQKSCNNL